MPTQPRLAARTTASTRVADAELGQDRTHVMLGRARGDAQRRRDVGVGGSVGEQVEHLGLTLGQAARMLPGGVRRGRGTRPPMAVSRTPTRVAAPDAPEVRQDADGVRYALHVVRQA